MLEYFSKDSICPYYCTFLDCARIDDDDGDDVYTEFNSELSAIDHYIKYNDRR